MSLPVTIVLSHRVQNENINYNRTIFVSEINLSFFVLFSFLLHDLWVVVGSGETKKEGDIMYLGECNDMSAKVEKSLSFSDGEKKTGME